MNNSSFSLERGDILQVESISHRGTFKLLPLGKKNKQKLVIGDDSGTVSCYEFRKGEPQVVFQVKVFDGPITCLAIGGTEPKKDKIFASHNQRIVGMTKKGKVFFNLTSSLTETIKSIWVDDTRIWTGCEFIYNLYDNGKDSAYFNSKDKINDVFVAHLTREVDYDVVLGCQDNCMRIIHDSILFLEVPTTNPVTAMAFIDLKRKNGIDTIGIDGGTANQGIVAGLVYGMDTGTIALVRIRGNPRGVPEYEEVWSVPDTDAGRSGSVTCIKLSELSPRHSSEGNMSIIVGRDDGRIEVFQRDSIEGTPYPVFSRDIGERVCSIEIGMVNSSDFNEVIVASFSGKVISFTTEPVLERATDDNYGRSVQTINNENRIKHMKKELDDLKKKVEKGRDQTKKAASSVWSGTAAGGGPPIHAVDFPVNAKFALDSSLGVYVLSLELQSPIDLIILRSPVVLHLVETDTGSSVLSVTPPHLQPGYDSSRDLEGSDDGSQSGGSLSGGGVAGKFVAVFRCQSDEKRIQLNLRTNEGEHGELQITIVAATGAGGASSSSSSGSSPNKSAKTLKYELKPLSLNAKVHSMSEAERARPRNSIRYTGTMSMTVLHEWVMSLFPDVPPRLDDQATEQTHYFRNSFTGAITVVEFKKGEIVFRSENASCIAIVKEQVTRMANYRRITLEEHIGTEEGSLPCFLGLLRERLEHQLSLSRKMQIVEAVQEVAMLEGERPSWLSQEYAEILASQDQIRAEFKQRDKSLEYLVGIITDLFVDWHKLHGLDVKARLAGFQNTVLQGSFDDLLTAFHPGAASSSSSMQGQGQGGIASSGSYDQSSVGRSLSQGPGGMRGSGSQRGFPFRG